MSLLTTVQRASALLGLTPPVSVAATDDPFARQAAELARIDAEDLASRANWGALVTETTFTTVADVSQPDALPSDFDRFTFRDSDQGELYLVGSRRGIAGPASDVQWRELTSGASGWVTGWRISGGVLQLAPAPSAGVEIAFSYVSNNLYLDAAGTTPKATWIAGGETCRLPERLIALGIVWRWKQAKGLEYAEEMRSAEIEIERAAGSTRGRRMLVIGRIRLPVGLDQPYPGVVGSPGNADLIGQY